MMNRMFVIAALCVGLVACSDDSGTPSGLRDLGGEDVGTDTTPDLGTEEDLPSTPPEISVDQEVLVYERIEVGESKTLSVFVTNSGTQDLVIADALVEELDRQGPSEFKKGPKWINGTTIVPANTFVELQVVYEPSDYSSDRGTLTIISNDEDEPRIEVRLQTINAYADLEAPKLIRFGSVDVGMSETQRIYMYNRGAVPLTLTAIEKSGLGPFVVQFIPTELLPKVLQPDEQYGFDLVYSPDTDAVHRATLTVTSDDPDDGAYEIALLGNSPSACIRPTPDVVDFGALAPGATATQMLTVFNCSSVLPLEVTAVELSDDAGGVFAIQPVQTPLMIGGFMTSVVAVTATAGDVEAVGELKIDSNDDQSSPTYVGLRMQIAE